MPNRKDIRKVLKNKEAELTDKAAGLLKSEAYNNIKNEIKYVKLDEDIELIIPEKYKDSLIPELEKMITKDISVIKKEENVLSLIAISLLFGGVIFFILASFIQNQIFHEIFIIATWAFVWAAIEKHFFEQPSLRLSRLKLVHLACAKIK